jgi:valyl-tRNA synthetase
MQFIIEVITALRNIRGEMNLPPGEQIDVIFRTKTSEAAAILGENQPFIRSLARVNGIRLGQDLEKPLYCALVVVRNTEVIVPVERSRMEEELKRLQKEIQKMEKEIAFVGKKLSNEQFVKKAPPQVVQEEKEKAAQYEAVRNKLEENLNKIKEALG